MNLSKPQKIKQAISITRSNRIVWSVLKIGARAGKDLMWTNRGLKGRLGIGGALIGLALFGGQGAGIAALGTAIGVPLWIVLGAGAAFAGMLYEEITGKKIDPKTSYKVIDAEREGDEHKRR